MSEKLKTDPWGYLLGFENADVVVRTVNGKEISGYIEIVDDDDTFDRKEPSITLLAGNKMELIFASDIESIKSLN